MSAKRFGVRQLAAAFVTSQREPVHKRQQAAALQSGGGAAATAAGDKRLDTKDLSANHDLMSRLPTRHEILELSVAERVQLIERIWDTIDANQLPLPESHRRALDEAIDEYGNRPDEGRPWDEVRDDLFRKK